MLVVALLLQLLFVVVVVVVAVRQCPCSQKLKEDIQEKFSNPALIAFNASQFELGNLLNLALYLKFTFAKF